MSDSDLFMMVSQNTIPRGDLIGIRSAPLLGIHHDPSGIKPRAQFPALFMQRFTDTNYYQKRHTATSVIVETMVLYMVVYI